LAAWVICAEYCGNCCAVASAPAKDLVSDASVAEETLSASDEAAMVALNAEA